jgi:acyl carrier protein
MTVREELVALIRTLNVDLSADVHDDTPLITSGVLDSLALWNLVLWVEKRIGIPLDPATVDIVAEWDTVASLLSFLERRRAMRLEATDARRRSTR